MSAYKSNPLDDWVDARLEAYVDGELSHDERLRLETYVRVHPEGEEKLRLSRMVSRELSSIQAPTCPPELTRAVLAQARAEAERMNPVRATTGVAVDAIRTRFQAIWVTFLRPSLAVAVLAAMVAAGALVGRSLPQQSTFSASADTQTSASSGVAAGPTAEAAPPAAQTSAEVEKALHDTKWALAFVTDVSREAGQSIRRNVLHERIAEPIHRALGAAFDNEPKS